MSRPGSSGYLTRVLQTTVYTLFLVGGLLSAYLFYLSVRDIFAYMPQTSSVQLPLGNEPGTGPETVPDWSQRERVNILLLGVDQRPNEEGPWRSDTMVVVSVDPQSMTAGALSIPRDLYVEIP
ncbi:MAG: LCP family protein, partial [Anaerolineae bacterium]|nr:LCP family protein [Anaerolineae bacterium]